MGWRGRQRDHTPRLTLAEAHLRAQCAALEAQRGGDAADAPGLVDLAALERQRRLAGRGGAGPPSDEPTTDRAPTRRRRSRGPAG